MEVTVRVEVHYCTPPGTVLGDVLRLLRSQTWMAFMTRHIGPRLEKVSPVDASVLKGLHRQWQEAPRATPVDCVICMNTGDDDTAEGKTRPKDNSVQLPCGHVFHRRCIYSWLELQSTCPICRWQFPKEFAGRFNVRRLRSTAVLPERIRSWPRSSIALAPVGGHSVRVVVSLTLEKALTITPFGRASCPCELTALLLDEASGEISSEMDICLLMDSCQPWEDHAGRPRHRIASTRFASVEETKFSDEFSSNSVAPTETGRKRRCFRLQQTVASKRQRVSSE